MISGITLICRFIHPALPVQFLRSATDIRGERHFPLLQHQPAGIAAVIGHNWPVWLRFRGGMGLATGAGAVISLAWPVVLIAAASLVIIRLLIIRHSPRATIAASCIIPVALWLLHYPPPIFWLGTGIALLIVMRYSSDWNRKYT